MLLDDGDASGESDSSSEDGFGDEDDSELTVNEFKIIVVGDISTGKTSLIRRYVWDKFTDTYKATLGVDFAFKRLNWDEDNIVKLQLWDCAGGERFNTMTHVYYRDAVAAMVVYDVSRPETLASVSTWRSNLDANLVDDEYDGADEGEEFSDGVDFEKVDMDKDEGRDREDEWRDPDSIMAVERDYGSISSMPILLVGNKCDLRKPSSMTRPKSSPESDEQQQTESDSKATTTKSDSDSDSEPEEREFDVSAVVRESDGCCPAPAKAFLHNYGFFAYVETSAKHGIGIDDAIRLLVARILERQRERRRRELNRSMLLMKNGTATAAVGSVGGRGHEEGGGAAFVLGRQDDGKRVRDESFLQGSRSRFLAQHSGPAAQRKGCCS